MKNLVDTHLHLYDDTYDENRDEIIKQINEKLDFIVNISCDYETSLSCIEYANNNDKMFATIGYHPCDISKYDEDKMKELINISKNNNKIVAIGEIGLDYHWMNDPIEVQKEGFKKQIELAIENDLPIVIHTREALDDTLEIVKSYPKLRGIMHCYPGSYEEVLPILDRFYVGVGGTVTFKNNKIGHEMVEKMPIDRIVIETDSPYLTPVPFRGKPNNPVYVEYVVNKIAEIKNMDVEEVKRITTENAKKVYGICIK
ncbi:TatD family hydrolase [Pseudostreptobacillus hongkongensis]|uniref:TatD family hydrolase n=1 Tax=Pseudostreptobacillus hongkongensis TaxID=1162717 RepID=UPI0008317298|nr:TatD family hydrolase [Pseudostreptobacillus hongkongensis]